MVSVVRHGNAIYRNDLRICVHDFWERLPSSMDENDYYHGVAICRRIATVASVGERVMLLNK